MIQTLYGLLFILSLIGLLQILLRNKIKKSAELCDHFFYTIECENAWRGHGYGMMKIQKCNRCPFSQNIHFIPEIPEVDGYEWRSKKNGNKRGD